MLRLFIRVLFNRTAMRGDDDEIRLLSIVLCHLKESNSVRFARKWRGIDHRSADNCFDLYTRAKTLPARLAGANNICPVGIVHIRWRVGLFHRVKSNETEIVLSRDSDLLTHGAANRIQRPRVGRAAFCVALQHILLGQPEFQYLRIVLGRCNPI